MKAYSFPLLVLLAETGLALYATSSQTADQMSQNARLLRSMPDVNFMHGSFDHTGEGSLTEMDGATSKSAICSPSHNASGSGPTVGNGGFETGSETTDYQQFDPAWSNFTWSALQGDYPEVVADNSVYYQNVRAAKGSSYLLALPTRDSGVVQCVPGHTQNNWYRVVFHAGYEQPSAGCDAATSSAQGSLKVMVNAKVKFNEPINCGSMVWYAVTYKALEADGNELLSFINSGAAVNGSAVFIDEVYIEPVHIWDESGSNAGNQRVLLQKVECTGYPAADTCQLGRFLSVGDETDAQLLDGRSTINEDNAAHRNSVFWTVHDTSQQRWSFKSDKLDVESTSASRSTTEPTMWYLHADYASCEARNWKKRPTSGFYVKTNGLGYHQISSTGTECGSLFAIQKFTPPDATR